MANPLIVAPRHWEAIATENFFSTITRYSPNAVLVWNDGTIDIVYRGDDIHRAWQQFFSEYQIQDYQVFEQNSRGRTVTAELSVIAKLDTAADAYPLVTSPYAVFKISCQVFFDDQGKILHEIWQTTSEINV